MDDAIRTAQQQVLRAFAQAARGFALAGGTALELYYLKHRFSSDLDFFSPEYDAKEISAILGCIENSQGAKVKLQAEFAAPNRARVRFYSLRVKRSARPLKIDFIEDVLFDRPKIKKFSGVPVYSVDRIYRQKIAALAGGWSRQDATGREVSQGRMEARDAFDIFVLSRKIQPLHLFLKDLPGSLQRGVIHWYRTFSRQDMKLGLLDLDIYDRDFNAREMISHLKEEIKVFIKQML